MKRNERGQVSVEVALLIPVFVLVIGLATAFWRISWVNSQLEASVAAAARLGVGTQGTTALQQRANTLVANDMRTAGIHCKDLSVAINVSVAGSLPGQSGDVYVSASCQVSLSDLLLPGFPGSVNVKAGATEAVDTYALPGR